MIFKIDSGYNPRGDEGYEDDRDNHGGYYAILGGFSQQNFGTGFVFP